MSWRRDQQGNVDDPDGTGPVNENTQDPRSDEQRHSS